MRFQKRRIHPEGSPSLLAGTIQNGTGGNRESRGVSIPLFDFEPQNDPPRLVNQAEPCQLKFCLGFPSLFSLLSPVQLHCFGLGRGPG